MESNLAGVHDKIYQQLLQHPAPHNLEWRDVCSMFRAMPDVVVDEKHNGHLTVTRNGEVLVLHPPHGKDLENKADITRIRHFLENSGEPAPTASATGTHLLVVIDHREARIYNAELHGTLPHRITPYDPFGFGRDLHFSQTGGDGKQQGERKSFYDAVAKTLANAKQILIFGTATGASSAMEHLLLDLKTHHHEVAARIIGSVVIDEHHLTEDQLLAKAREFFANPVARKASDPDPRITHEDRSRPPRAAAFAWPPHRGILSRICLRFLMLSHFKAQGPPRYWTFRSLFAWARPHGQVISLARSRSIGHLSPRGIHPGDEVLCRPQHLEGKEYMSTLLDRAKSLIASRSAHAAVLALTPLAAATANADAFDWTHNSTRLQYVQSGGGGGWVDYDVPTASVGSAYLPTNGIKLYGTGSDDGSAFSMTGAQYRRSFDDTLRGNRLIMSGTSTFDGAHWTHPTDYISTLFKYGITVTGGNVEMYSVETGFTLYDAANNFLIGVGSSTGGFNYTVGHTDTSFGFEDRFGSNFETGTHLDWTVAFYFDWTGVDFDDSIEFFIPNNSVDIQVVPAPAAAGLLGFAGLLGARRRRR